MGVLDNILRSSRRPGRETPEWDSDFPKHTQPGRGRAVNHTQRSALHPPPSCLLMRFTVTISIILILGFHRQKMNGCAILASLVHDRYWILINSARKMLIEF